MAKYEGNDLDNTGSSPLPRGGSHGSYSDSPSQGYNPSHLAVAEFAGGLEGPYCIFVGGLPYHFTEVQIRDLLESFGPLQGFHLVKDRDKGNSKGSAFCVYQDPLVTDLAVCALNGLKMGDKSLIVRRANEGATQSKPEQEHALQQITLQGYNPSHLAAVELTPESAGGPFLYFCWWVPLSFYRSTDQGSARVLWAPSGLSFSEGQRHGKLQWLCILCLPGSFCYRYSRLFSQWP